MTHVLQVLGSRCRPADVSSQDPTPLRSLEMAPQVTQYSGNGAYGSGTRFDN